MPGICTCITTYPNDLMIQPPTPSIRIWPQMSWFSSLIGPTSRLQAFTNEGVTEFIWAPLSMRATVDSLSMRTWPRFSRPSQWVWGSWFQYWEGVCWSGFTVEPGPVGPQPDQPGGGCSLLLLLCPLSSLTWPPVPALVSGYTSSSDAPPEYNCSNG